VRTYRGTNVNLDHYLVITRIRAKISRSTYILNKETKVKIYKTIIKPIIFSGSERWTLTKVNDEKLKIYSGKF
jgi:hypothetical protein